MWGWARLVEWHNQAKDTRAAVEAALGYVGAFPDDATALAYLGDAHHQSALAGRADVAAHKEAARTLLRKAIEIDPSMDGAARRLLTLQFEARDLDGADRTLATVRPVASAGFLASAAARIALHRQRSADAGKAIEEFLRAADASRFDAQPLLADLEKTKMLGILTPVVKTEALRPDATALTGQILVWDLFRRMDFLGAEKFFHGNTHSPAWAAAAEDWIEGLAEKRHSGRLMAFLNFHQARLLESTELRDTAVRALLRFNESKRAAPYAQGWQARTGLDANMLLNIALVELDNGGDAAAREACRRTEGRREGELGARLATIAAWLAAKAGEADAADREIAQAKGPKLTTYYKSLLSLATAVRETLRPGPCEFRRLLHMNKLVKAARSVVTENQVDDFLRNSFRETVRRVARHRGGVLGFLWKVWAWR